jgi:hypothetical protein
VVPSRDAGVKKLVGPEPESKDGVSDKGQLLEILLCLRPIREAPSSQVGKESSFHRFSKKNVKKTGVKVASETSLTSGDGQRVVSEESNTERSSNDEPKAETSADSDGFLLATFRPLKKRAPPRSEEVVSTDMQQYPTPNKSNKNKRKRSNEDSLDASALDASVVAESLMMMTKQHKKI